MKNSWFRDIFQTIVIVFFQVAVLNFLNVSAYVIPFIYPVLILGLSRSMNKSLLLVLGFSLGIIIDMYSNTGGAHAMGMTVLAFLRPYLLASLGPTDSGSENINPSVYNLGLQSYAVYAAILLGAHHLVVFFIEVFTFSNIVTTLIRSFASTAVSLLLVILIQFIFVKRDN